MNLPERSIAHSFNIDVVRLFKAFGIPDDLHGIIGINLDIQSGRLLELTIKREISVEEYDAIVTAIENNSPTLIETKEQP